jgi:1,4-dihydroxy-2-naphthoyl-CoA synthase
VEYGSHSTLKVTVEKAIASITIDHGELNLMDMAMLEDLDRVGRQIETDPAVKVVVLQSANPQFFIAHADINVITRHPATPPVRQDKLGWVHAVLDRFRTMPKATIAKIQGRCRGGGSELRLRRLPGRARRTLRLRQPGAARRRDRLLRAVPRAAHCGLHGRDDRAGQAGRSHE